MKLGDIIVHMGNYIFTKFHQNQMKKKSFINSPFFCSEFQSVSRIVKIIHSALLHYFSIFSLLWIDELLFLQKKFFGGGLSSSFEDKRLESAPSKYVLWENKNLKAADSPIGIPQRTEKYQIWLLFRKTCSSLPLI